MKKFMRDFFTGLQFVVAFYFAVMAKTSIVESIFSLCKKTHIPEKLRTNLPV